MLHNILMLKMLNSYHRMLIYNDIFFLLVLHIQFCYYL